MSIDRRLGPARIHFFSGKGGVGKSSIVAACALRAAQEGKRPLIVELAHRDTMRLLFDAPVGGEPSPVGDGVFALVVDLERALGDLLQARIGLRRFAKFNAVQRFVSAAPSITELLTLDFAPFAGGGARGEMRRVGIRFWWTSMRRDTRGCSYRFPPCLKVW